ncbi:hypothetical protein HNQ94_001114 [Salirhabdus euzebyi]|uniref:Nucleotidyltransferase n=1 Tax=Salirhabdus euzebyi TaxID=394506 RepID=A0A841Q359_9BACI|nr:nucleotidyltransferase [Salirhabdus euzebyi]MBB6452668.1 hypothetical protein [Salirhabdus euzebyi]
MNIRNIGRYCKVDKNGYILKEANFKHVTKEFAPLIEEVTKTYHSHIGNNLHSLYIRGSIPRGLGIEGVADLDTIAITKQNPEHLSLEWVEDAEDRINFKFDYINGVELSFYHIEEVLEKTSFSIIPFMIKTHSLCIYGEDIANQLPKYKADYTLANEHLIRLSGQLQRAKDDLKDNDDAEDILDCCVWIMKIIVRAGLALVLTKENLYTRDLYPAYSLFSKYYPEKEPDMRQALQFAIAPTTDTEILLHFLQLFGKWLKKESDVWLQKYNPNKEFKLRL